MWLASIKFLSTAVRMQILVIGIIAGTALLSGCEDLIELDLHDAGPQLVIVGEITNRQRTHTVTIHQTVPVSSGRLADPVSGATVRVTDENGRVFHFAETEPGVYISGVFRGVIGRTYTLETIVSGVHYTAQSTMPEIVNIDSIGTSSSRIFGEESMYITLKFNDPPRVANYYRYLTSVNGGPFQFNSIFNDTFNDGLHVSHELRNFGVDLEIGDEVKIQRQHIDAATYLYWRSIASSNPASAAPANPPSNINHGALGYFSAYAVNEYEVVIPDPDQVND